MKMLRGKIGKFTRKCKILCGETCKPRNKTEKKWKLKLEDEKEIDMKPL